jgi:hypothetical protein
MAQAIANLSSEGVANLNASGVNSEQGFDVPGTYEMPAGYVPLTAELLNGNDSNQNLSTTSVPLQSLEKHLTKKPSLQALAEQHFPDTIVPNPQPEINTDFQATNPIPSIGDEQTSSQDPRLSQTAEFQSQFAYQAPQTIFNNEPIPRTAPNSFSLPSLVQPVNPQQIQPQTVFQSPQTINKINDGNFSRFVYQPSSEVGSFTGQPLGNQTGGIRPELAQQLPKKTNTLSPKTLLHTNIVQANKNPGDNGNQKPTNPIKTPPNSPVHAPVRITNSGFGKNLRFNDPTSVLEFQDAAKAKRRGAVTNV